MLYLSKDFFKVIKIKLTYKAPYESACLCFVLHHFFLDTILDKNRSCTLYTYIRYCNLLQPAGSIIIHNYRTLILSYRLKVGHVYTVGTYSIASIPFHALSYYTIGIDCTIGKHASTKFCIFYQVTFYLYYYELYTFDLRSIKKVFFLNEGAEKVHIISMKNLIPYVNHLRK